MFTSSASYNQEAKVSWRAQILMMNGRCDLYGHSRTLLREQLSEESLGRLPPVSHATPTGPHALKDRTGHHHTQ